MMSDFDLRSICFNSSNCQADNFVGISFENDDVKVFFPMGYRIPDNNLECRISILNLINVISIVKNKQFDSRFGLDSGSGYEIPINSYIWIISDYLNNGLYFDIEKKYVKNQSGKINWKKTINSKYYVSDNNIVYLDLYVERKFSEKSIITDIQMFCLEKSIKEIGWLFGNISSPRSNLDENNLIYYINIINKELIRTFDDKKKRLLVHMRKILENTFSNENDTISKKYGTHDFDYVWEYMIGDVFGNEDVSEFFPDSSLFILDWEEKKASYLRPDTILSFGNNIYILDSKYYRFGVVTRENEKYLPQTDSIQKQITYGENIFNKNKYEKVYNAFVMPYNKDNNIFDKHDDTQYVGYAKSNWKEEKVSSRLYEHIALILADTKYIMDCFLRKRETDILELVNSIENVRYSFKYFDYNNRED